MATGKERGQLLRDRKQRGIIAVVPVEVDAGAICGLEWKGHLGDDATDDAGNVIDKGAVAEAIRAALDDMAEEAYQDYLAVEKAEGTAAAEGDQ